MNIETKLLQKTDRTGECWVYLGQTSKRYAEIRIANARLGIHRWSYTHYHGDIPYGHQVDHICRNTKCWNPDHLRVLSKIENERSNWVAERHKARTHCNHGHPFDATNTDYRPDGYRRCKTCHAANSVAQYRRNKGVSSCISA